MWNMKLKFKYIELNLKKAPLCLVKYMFQCSKQVKADTLIWNPVAYKIDFGGIECVQNFIMMS